MMRLIILIILMVLLAQYSYADINGGLAVWLKLDDNSGTTAADSSTAFSGTTNNGTLTNMVPTWVTGHNTYAVSFDGADDYINFNYTPVLTAFTLCVWVKPSANTKSIIAQTDASGTGVSVSHQLRINSSNQYEIYVWDGAVNTVTSSTTYSSSRWDFVCGTGLNNSVIRLYVNGTEEGTSDGVGTMWAGGDRFRVGEQTIVGLGYFAGTIDNVRLYNRALSAGEIQDLYTRDSLVGWWKLDDNSGVTATDSSGFGNSGTLTGNAAWATGRIGYGVSFDGTGDYIDLGNTGNLSGSTGITLSAWYYPTALGTTHTIIFRGESTTTKAYVLYVVSSGVVRFRVSTTSSGTSASTALDTTATIATTNQWYHLAATYSDSDDTMRIYINGVQSISGGTATGALVDGANGRRIGINADNSSLPLNGKVDDIRIYDHALTATEVRKIFILNARSTANDGF